jgi:NADPH:quinone reductase-like Zn-dependent oxidoreductase
MARPHLEALCADLAARVADGTLRVEVEATYSIEEIKAALAHAKREGRSRKILVPPNGPVG